MASLGTITGQVRLDTRQAVASYAALRSQNARTVYALRGTGDSMVAAGRTMATAGLGMVYAFGKVVNAAAEFERKLDYFGAVTGTNAKMMQRLSKYTLQLGQDTIYSANEIADGFVELGKSGINAKQIMHGVGEAMASLGAAGDIPLVQSAQIITSSVAQFALKARDATHVADLLAGAANASIADITDIGYSLKYVGGIAHVAGLGLEDVTTAIAVLAQAGIKGSTAGTTLRQMIVSLPGVTKKARDELKELGIITKDGTNKFYTQKGELKPLSRVYQILGDSMKGLTAQQKTSALRTIFQTRALSAAAVLTRAGAKGFKNMYKEMSKVTAAEVAHKRLDNLSGDIEILRGNIETLVIQAGGPFQNMMRGWVQNLTKLIQAYGDLDPETQKNIVATIGIAGAVLTAMGAISIILGTIFKFVAAMLKLGAGLRFIWGLISAVFGAFAGFDIIGLVTTALYVLAGVLGISVGWLVAIIAAVVAVVAGLVILYVKCDAVRNAVNGFAMAVWDALKAVGSFFKTLATNPGKIWDGIKRGVESVGKFFQKLPGLMMKGLDAGLSAVGGWIGDVVGYFKGLGGRLISTVTGFIAKVASYFTFRNAGYAIGYFIGTVVRLFMTLPPKIALAVLRAVNAVYQNFKTLPGKIGYLIGFMVGRVLGFMIRLAIRMNALAARAVIGVVKFFQKLPGRIAAFVTRMVVKTTAAFLKMLHAIPGLAQNIVNGVSNFFQQLPGRIGAFVVNMANRAKNQFTKMKTNAVNMAREMLHGVVNTITGLPATIAQILDNCIQAFKDVITDAFNAAKDFAGGLWDGFKSGLGINSPSFIEKHMYQMNRTLDEESKKMAKKTAAIQKIGQRYVDRTTSFGTGGKPVVGASGASGYVKLASMHATNQQRARTLTDSAGKRSVADARRADRKGTGRPGEKMAMEITNWRSGHGFIRGIAQDAIDDDYDYSDTLGRMR